MDYYREKCCKGVMDLQTCQKMIDVLHHLEQRYYSFVEPLGEGTFGNVIKVKNILTDEERAVKVVSQEKVSDGEMTLWPTLSSQKNILPLLACDYVYYAKSYLFMTPVHPTTMEKEILNCTLPNKLKVVDERINWLSQVLDACAFLHKKNLGHLDLKSNNILISKERTAIVTDFGFLASTQYPIRRYGAPPLYRCPEGRRIFSGMTEVYGQKLDVWCIGTMAFEMFTRLALYQKMKNRKCRSNDWHKEVYPVLKKLLQKKKFSSLMHRAFPKSPSITEQVGDVMSFITSCLTIVPAKRPTVLQLQNHSLFGGDFKNVQLEPHEDIWCTRVGVQILKSDHRNSRKLVIKRRNNFKQNRSNTVVPVAKISNSVDNDPVQVIGEDVCTLQPLPVVLHNNAVVEIKKSSVSVIQNSASMSKPDPAEQSPLLVGSPKDISSLDQETISAVKSDRGNEPSCALSGVKSNFDGKAPEVKINEDICTDKRSPVVLDNNALVEKKQSSVRVSQKSTSISTPDPAEQSPLLVRSPKDISSLDQKTISAVQNDEGNEPSCALSGVKSNFDGKAQEVKINEAICTDERIPIVLDNNALVEIKQSSVPVSRMSDSILTPDPAEQSPFQAGSLKDNVSSEAKSEKKIDVCSKQPGESLDFKANSNGKIEQEKINPSLGNSSTVAKDDRVAGDSDATLVESSSSKESKAGSNFTQRIRSWFRNRKASIVRCFTSCTCCVKPSGKDK